MFLRQIGEIGGIVSWLRDEMNMHPEYVPGFLELLTVLPEETFNYKIATHLDRRRQFEKELTSQIEAAVLEAFASWLRLRHGFLEQCLPVIHWCIQLSQVLPVGKTNIYSFELYL